MSNFYRGFSIDVPTKFRFIWPSGFRGEEFFLIDQSETRNPYRGPSIDAFYQILVHLVQLYSEKIFLEIDQPETRIAYGSHVCF